MARFLISVLLVLIVISDARAQATEERLRVAQPEGYSHPVSLKKAELLLAWWGETETVPLRSRYDGSELVVIVPLDREVWASLNGQAPDFAYVYLEFVDQSHIRISLPADAPIGESRFCYVR